jgi:phage tail sheath protein FI
MAYAHGISVTETSALQRSMVTVATAVIGLLATAFDADATVFPLDTPVLITDLDAAIGKAGVAGTLHGALRAIADQARPVLIVIRVAPGADTAATNASVIGTTTAQGLKTGMQALLAAEGRLGIKPRILGAPGLDTLPVTTALTVIGKKLRAMVYAAAIGADLAAAITYRANFTSRELMLLTPDFVAFDTATGANAPSFAAARAMGLRAAIDAEQGWNKTISNVPVLGVLGTTKDIQFDIQDPSCEANLLNAQQVSTIVRTGGGFRIWGSRTCSADPLFAFESAVRTAHVLQDTIANGLTWAIDKPLRPSLVRDIVETINAEMRQLKTAELILGGRAWFDVQKNTSATLSAGKLTIDYDYTPTPPAESITLIQRITDSYFADLVAGVSANAA